MKNVLSECSAWTLSKDGKIYGTVWMSNLALKNQYRWSAKLKCWIAKHNTAIQVRAL